ncbi:FAD-dependent monooxygenase [Nitrobacter sp. JJSN]|uniref:FAD-dependent monooxygenase n=1 Tax=Nitrobacter sp. JJSN TaxID=3453033 RepID=UPI003F75F2B7
MTRSRTVVVAGAGIGGLTASLALAAKGFRVLIIETAERLEEAGAGLQLSPNASRILIGLGLHARLSACALVPDAISIMSARHGGEICRLPLAETATSRAGAPYWVVHRADLQSALLEQVGAHPDIELRLGTAIENATSHTEGVTVNLRGSSPDREKTAWALIGADGVWSALRDRLFPDASPLFSGLIAWRGTIDAAHLPHDMTARRVQLWMGPDVHVVAYPMSGGRQINIVALMPDAWNQPGWSAPGDAADIKRRFAQARWSEPARRMIDAVDGWRKWALFTIPPMAAWHCDAMALLGDAAHAMLPFAAQGAGMAIEDAAVLAQCLGDATNERGDGAAAALARYTGLRRARVTRVQKLAQLNGRIYHLGGAAALARDLAIRTMGPQRMLARQDWIYNWRP